MRFWVRDTHQPELIHLYHQPLGWHLLGRLLPSLANRRRTMAYVGLYVGDPARFTPRRLSWLEGDRGPSANGG